MNLTGKTRFRTLNRWRRSPLLVLQVEYQYLHTESFGAYIDCERVKRWRDATVTDIKVDCPLAEQKQ